MVGAPKRPRLRFFQALLMEDNEANFISNFHAAFWQRRVRDPPSPAHKEDAMLSLWCILCCSLAALPEVEMALSLLCRFQH